MRAFAQFISVIGHPVFIPLFAVVFYFYKLPVFFSKDVVQAKIIATIIISVFIPLVFLYFFKTLRLISSFELPTAKERRLPLLFLMMLDLVIINYIFELYNYQHLFYFFWSLLLASMFVFVALFFRFKVSLHALGISSFLSFVCVLSYEFNLNFLALIMLLLFITGVISTSRLILKAHQPIEVYSGLLLGVFTQLLIPLAHFYKM